MGAVNTRGIWVPAVGDGLIAAWETMAAQMGAYLPVASVAAASAALDAAQAAGMGATTSNPILFLVGATVKKVAYVADGTKTSGKWNLAPLNEVQVQENTAGVTTVSGLAQFQMKPIITSTLPAAPFDRVVIANGQSFGRVTAGIVNLGLRIGSSADQAESRYRDANVSGATSVNNSGIIPANTEPVIILGAVGDSPSVSSAVSVGSVEKHSRLVVTAFPISMSV